MAPAMLSLVVGRQRWRVLALRSVMRALIAPHDCRFELSRFESKQPAEDLEGVAPVVSSPIGTLSHAEAPAPPQRFNFPGAGGVGGSSARPTAARGVTAPGCSGALRPIDGRKGDGDMISY